MKINKEVINYLFFGVLTTVLSILTYLLFNIILGRDFYLISNIISWIIAVAFAFVTNKLWVFCSKDWSVKTLKTELISFVFARLFSLVLEEAGLFLFIELLNFKNFDLFMISGDLIAKLIMQAIVIITNYLFSKFWIFKK